MQSSDQYDFRLSKYHKLNLIVIVAILAILLAVFFWYERSLDKIDEEMTKEMITKNWLRKENEFPLREAIKIPGELLLVK